MKEKPTKLSLALAKTFADQAAVYVNMDEFSVLPRQAIVVPGQESTMQHVFSIAMRPDVPLNGYESKEWLTSYAIEMRRLVTTLGPRIKRQQNLDLPISDIDKYIDDQTKKYEGAVRALERARKLLEEK